MKKLTVNVGKGYDILIEKGIINHTVDYIKNVTKQKKYAL